MASACALFGKTGSSWVRFGGKKISQKNYNRSGKVSCSYSSSVMDPYKTLRIHRGASEVEVRKAFRQLALQYHPDVCKGDNCGTQFHLINEAYDIVMSTLRDETEESLQTNEAFDDDVVIDEPFRGMNDPDWDLWEEWMGWEGAGIRDYSSHINPYI